jgi:hypothetical protein
VQLLERTILAPPLPDGAITQDDRQHIAGVYSGILASTGLTVIPTTAAASSGVLAPGVVQGFAGPSLVLGPVAAGASSDIVGPSVILGAPTVVVPPVVEPPPVLVEDRSTHSLGVCPICREIYVIWTRYPHECRKGAARRRW